MPPSSLFQGYDSIKGIGKAAAVTGTPAAPSSASNQMYYKVCTDVSSVSSAMNISGSASVGFGLGSVDAKASFAQSLDLTSTSVSIVVYVNVVTGTSQYDTVQLSPGVSTENIAAFVAAYGDSFVASIETGAEFIAVYTFLSTTVDQQTAVMTSLAASDTSGGSFDTSLTTNLQTASTATNVTVTMNQTVFGTDVALPTADALITFALNFPGLTPTAPIVMSFTRIGYEDVPGVSFTAFQPVVANRNLVLGTLGATGLVQTYATLMANQQGINFLEEIYTAYSYQGDTTMAANSSQVATDMQTINTLVSTIDNNPVATQVMPTLPSLGYGVPTLSFVIAPAMEGEGTSFGDVNFGFVESGMRLSAITMYSDTTQIVGVAVTYSAASLAVPPQIVSHGNTIDALASPPLLIPRADSVAKWSMLMTPDTIYQMTFTTARGDSQTWPLEPSSDSAAGSLSSGSGPVIGFTGSSQTSSGVFVIFANLLNLSPRYVFSGNLELMKQSSPFQNPGRWRIAVR